MRRQAIPEPFLAKFPPPTPHSRLPFVDSPSITTVLHLQRLHPTGLFKLSFPLHHPSSNPHSRSLFVPFLPTPKNLRSSTDSYEYPPPSSVTFFFLTFSPFFSSINSRLLGPPRPSLRLFCSSSFRPKELLPEWRNRVPFPSLHSRTPYFSLTLFEHDCVRDASETRER